MNENKSLIGIFLVVMFFGFLVVNSVWGQESVEGSIETALPIGYAIKSVPAISDLMASTTLDVVTTAQIFYSERQTKEITQRLDKIIYLLSH